MPSETVAVVRLGEFLTDGQRLVEVVDLSGEYAIVEDAKTGASFGVPLETVLRDYRRVGQADA